MSEFEIVERPQERSRRKLLEDDIAAVIETATTGKAVRVPLNGTQLMTIRERFYHACRIRGYQAHVQSGHGDYVLAWATKKESA